MSGIDEQRVGALLAALLAYEWMTPEVMEMAVSRAAAIEVGELCSSLAAGRYPTPMVRAFCAEQVRRLGSA